MKQFDDNDCANCGGTGSELSGVEHMGAHEMIGCDWCAGTGFEDVYLGVGRLRTEVIELTVTLKAVRKWEQSILNGAPAQYTAGYDQAQRDLRALLQQEK